MQAGHAEVESEKQRGMLGVGAAFAIEGSARNLVIHVLVMVFLGFYPEERPAQQ